MLVSTTIAGADAWLCLARPIWRDGVTARIDLPTDLEVGLTARETRTPLAQRVRTSCTFSTYLKDGDIATWQNALGQIGQTPVAVPFWPGLGFLAAPAVLDAAYYIRFAADRTWTIVEGGSRPSTIDAGELLVPVLLGRFNEVPIPELLDGRLAKVAVSFVEASPLTWIAGPTASFTAGPAAAVGAPPVWPLRMDWTPGPKTGSAETQIDRQQIGYRRETADTYYAQPPVRPLEFSCALQSQAEWIRLLSFFGQRQANAKPFWIRSGVSPASVAAAIASVDTSIQVDSVANIGTQRTFVLLDGVKSAIVKATAATNPLPLTGAVGAAFDQARTRLESLLLVRFAQSQLSLRWRAPDSASAQISVRELPAEYSTAGGETAGVTVGARLPIAHLYKFSIMYPGTPVDSRFTGEEDVTLSDGVHTWTGGHFEHSDISEALNLDKTQVTIKSRIFEGNPLGLYFPFQLEFPLRVEIYEARLADGAITGTPLRIFIGDIEDVSADGPILSANASAMGAVFDRAVPRLLFSQQCNYTVFHDGCPAIAADWEVSGAVNAAATNAATLYIRKPSGSWAPSDYPAHDFAGGVLRCVIGGSPVQRLITDSTAPDGGGIITL
ncbi:MAG TPA: hypothetical protein VMF06_15915, partial [Candidatus Limnocylindria bacterium]|nr:hypothetical protein [Candidatus Limnocylindria bacterium]